MEDQHIIEWLLKGDVSIQYQTFRDLLYTERVDLQLRIELEGWGKAFLTRRNPNGHWGERFYQPKWTSTHYTLLDLRNLGLPPGNKLVKESIESVLDSNVAEDGGIRLGPSTTLHSDTCVNGMFLNYASYFRTEEGRLRPLVDCILHERMTDGGFNCRKSHGGAHHSSLHSTISVLEGIVEFLKRGYTYRDDELREAKKTAEAFILLHRFFRSDRTGEIIKKEFLKLPYPSRWKYDILRGLDYFRYAGSAWDPRIGEALEVLLSKRNKEGAWNLWAAYPGQVHFTMEKAGKPSRWNTLRALRVLRHFNQPAMVSP